MEATESKIVLPTSIIPAEVKSPENLIIFSKPKMGKTTLISKLKDCLLLDLENGSNYVDALKIKASSVKEIIEIGKAIKAAGKPYKYIAIDTATALEDMCVLYAEELYAKSPMGKYWFTGKDGNPSPKSQYGNILNLPEGAGYKWLRDAFEKVLNYIKTWAPRTIIIAHIKDTQLDKQGVTFNSSDLDLAGKLKRICASKSDAIAYMTRKGKQTILSFKSSEEIACGARPEHLKGKEIVIAEEDETGEIEVFWERVFLD